MPATVFACLHTGDLVDWDTSYAAVVHPSGYMTTYKRRASVVRMALSSGRSRLVVVGPEAVVI